MIYGSYIYDLSIFAKAFDVLDISYVLYGSSYKDIKFVKHSRDFGVCVVESLSRLQAILETEHKYKVFFVCDAKSALDNSNVDKSLFVRFKTDNALCKKLEKLCSASPQPFTLQIKEYSLQEIVAKLTTKSILTDIQTLVNKINPYELRKKVHAVIISYLYGAVPFQDVKVLLANSTKLQALYTIMKEKEAKTLRTAVKEYKKVKDEYAVAKEFGLHTFEILYVFNSYSKL